MPKKLKLNLSDLNVNSFKTSSKVIGGLTAWEGSQHTLPPDTWVSTIDANNWCTYGENQCETLPTEYTTDL